MKPFVSAPGMELVPSHHRGRMSAVRFTASRLLAASLLLSLTQPLAAQQPAAPAAKVAPRPSAAEVRAIKGRSVEGITEYSLPNGLRVLLFPDPSKPTITVNITYMVGSRHEGYGETGMAHLLEHLMFKGTRKHPNVDQEFNQRGVRYNGTTWPYFTFQY